MTHDFIHYYFVIYGVLLAFWIFGYLIGCFIALVRDCHSKKKRHISIIKVYRTLLKAQIRCKELREDVKKRRSCISSESNLNTNININIKRATLRRTPSPMVLVNQCQQEIQAAQWVNTYNTFDKELEEIEKILNTDKVKQYSQPNRFSAFLSTGMLLIGQFIKIFILTTIVLLLSGCACIISLISISIISHLHIQQLSSAIYEFCNIRMEELGTSPFSMCLWIIFAIIFLILTVVLIKKAIQLISTQYDIIFLACQLSGTILITNQLNEHSIADEFYQMEKNIQIKNSSSQIGKMLHRLFD